MRQVFNAIPYILPAEDECTVKIFKKYGTVRKVKRGSVLKDGGDDNKLFFLKSGLCMYMVNYSLEKPRALGLLLPGRSMGDITCVSGEVVNVTTIAIRNSEVYVVPPDVLREKMSGDFELTMNVVKKLISKQECHIEGMLANFTLGHESRLAIFFKALLLSCGDENLGGEWKKLPVKLSNEELGLITHATRVTINRILSKWQSEGLYKKENDSRLVNTKIFSGIYDWRGYMGAMPDKISGMFT